IAVCDAFIEWATGSKDPSAKNYIQDSTDASGKRTLKCTDDDHILQMNDLLSPESGTCDPAVGWKTSTGEEVPDEMLTDPNYKIKLDCIYACHDRVEYACTKDQIFCAKYTNPVGTNSYSCPETHLMRVDNGNT
ncbi:hypothetical protein PMAYCL1PPCAC_19439, partial [Pristionchus mayeri]